MSPIASRPGRPYLTLMPITRLLQLVLLLAVMLAPLSMMSAHAAMAMAAPTAAATADHDMAEAPGGHCAEAARASGQAPDGGDAPTKSADCAIACSCVPPAAGQVAEQADFTARPHPPGRFPLPAGLSPEAEPRPPQLS